jgi:sodium transport system permease protein
MLLGWIAVRTRSLWPGILFHFLYNGLEVSRTRYGRHWEIPTEFQWFVRQESGLRYQPLLLVLCAIIAVGLMGILARRREPGADSSASLAEISSTPLLTVR